MLNNKITLTLTPPGRRAVTQELVSGTITCLSDNSAFMPSGWEYGVQKGTDSLPWRMTSQGKGVERDQILFIGFDDKLPEISVYEFVASFSNSADALLSEFELSSVKNLSCCFLPPETTRRLLLLKGVSKQDRIVFLNDPFLPFNGRWREAFAEYITRYTAKNNLIVICTNVNFAPTTWGKDSSVLNIDIASFLVVPITVQPSVQAVVVKVSEQPTKRDVSDKNQHYYVAGIPLPIPDLAIRAYTASRDRIFAPLARLSHFLRTWSGAVAAASLSLVVLTVGTVFAPNLSASHETLKAISARLNWTWTEVKQAVLPAATNEQTIVQTEPIVTNTTPEDSVVEKHKDLVNPSSYPKHSLSSIWEDHGMQSDSALLSNLASFAAAFSSPHQNNFTLRCLPFEQCSLALPYQKSSEEALPETYPVQSKPFSAQ